jgi:hypothetical protein
MLWASEFYAWVSRFGVWLLLVIEIDPWGLLI